MNKSNEIIKNSIDSGKIKVIDGVVFYNGKKRSLIFKVNRSGYIRVVVSVFLNGTVYPISVSRLVAYKKFGNKLFGKGNQVRHLDGNSTNNHEYNIELGSQSDNMMDKPEQERLKTSLNASSKLRRWTDDEEMEIFNFYSLCKSYKKTQEKFGISSKGSLWHILHKIKNNNTPLSSLPKRHRPLA